MNLKIYEDAKYATVNAKEAWIMHGAQKTRCANDEEVNEPGSKAFDGNEANGTQIVAHTSLPGSSRPSLDVEGASFSRVLTVARPAIPPDASFCVFFGRMRHLQPL